MTVPISLAAGADENGFCVMLADLLRQNLESKPHKMRDFKRLCANVAIVVEDAGVALTLCFDGDQLVIRDGIYGVPDATVRGDADSIIGMSNVPLSRRFGLPWARRSDPGERAALKAFVDAVRNGRVHTHARLATVPALARLTRVMSVHG